MSLSDVTRADEGLIALNAISALDIAGLASDPGGVEDISVTVQVKRIVPPPVQLHPSSWGSVDSLPEGLPPPPTSKLPPPGKLHLSVSLNKILGKGRSGLVYSTTVLNPVCPLPPLVAKVARKGYQGDVIREAAFYVELESLQGISVPRCYGVFEGQLAEGLELENEKEMVSDPESDSDDECDPTEDMVRKRADAASNRVCVLLLERLGDSFLPLGKPIPEETEADLVALFEDFAPLGICHVDLRYANILPVGPSTALRCPRHNCKHNWRIFDFNNAEKIASKPDSLNLNHRSRLDDMLSAVASGHILEPWDV